MSDPDLLTVQADSANSSLGWAALGERRWRCVIGAGGAREDKVEGDAATPVGTFPLRRLYFRNDRLVLPKVRPAGPADQRARRLVRRSALVRLQPPGPHPERVEPREDCGATTGCTTCWWWSATTTTRPKANGAARSSCTSPATTSSPTQGCVAFARDDLLELVPLLTPQTKLQVLGRSAAELTAPSATWRTTGAHRKDFDEKDGKPLIQVLQQFGVLVEETDIFSPQPARVPPRRAHSARTHCGRHL